MKNEEARSAPSGHNSQSTEYLVVQDRAVLDQVFESGADPILNDAPVLLAFHAPRHIGYADTNAQLALQDASLVAHALGVGHFYTGWVLAPCRALMARAWNRRMPDLIGIPPGNELYGALLPGYPIPRFKNMIERKPAQVRWA